jgi:DNA-directed RNA polymerase specialized sigma24 family protein
LKQTRDAAKADRQLETLQRLAGRRELDPDQVEELVNRIDAERACRDMLAGLAALPERDRAVIELVDIAGLRPQEAAALGLAPGVVRMRLLRARSRLRRQAQPEGDAAQADNDNPNLRGRQ